MLDLSPIGVGNVNNSIVCIKMNNRSLIKMEKWLTSDRSPDLIRGVSGRFPCGEN